MTRMEGLHWACEIWSVAVTFVNMEDAVSRDTFSLAGHAEEKE